MPSLTKEFLLSCYLLGEGKELCFVFIVPLFCFLVYGHWKISCASVDSTQPQPQSHIIDVKRTNWT